LIASIVRPVKSVVPPILQGVQQAAHSVSDAVGNADSKFTSAVKMSAWFTGGLATVAGCVLCYRSEIGSAASVVGCWQAVKNGLGISRIEKGQQRLINGQDGMKKGLAKLALGMQMLGEQQSLFGVILRNVAGDVRTIKGQVAQLTGLPAGLERNQVELKEMNGKLTSIQKQLAILDERRHQPHSLSFCQSPATRAALSFVPGIVNGNNGRRQGLTALVD